MRVSGSGLQMTLDLSGLSPELRKKAARVAAAL